MVGRGSWGGRREGQGSGEFWGPELTSVGSKYGRALRLPGTEGSSEDKGGRGEMKRLK